MNFKKLICSILISTICCTVFIPVSYARTILGDVDGDGVITSADARLALRAAVGLENFSASKKEAADIDGSGDITSSDARSILRMSVGLSIDGNTSIGTFEKNLYDLSHSFLGKTFDYPIQKWCCMYTMIHVLRPTLKNTGYDDKRIDQIAPAQASPSALALYYHNNPQYCTVFTMKDYCNEWLYYQHLLSANKSASIVKKSSNAGSYRPQIGDIVIMVNKERSKLTVNDVVYQTLDHTAQIIKVYSDGTFLCTEGCITTKLDNGDSRGYVVERLYKYDQDAGTYIFVNNDIVQILDIFRPNY